MRFLLKIGFWVALIAFFLPSPKAEEPGGSVDYLGALLGAQQALSDAGGFCERAPQACSAGRELGSFVAARVGDGLALGYAAIRPAAEPAIVRPEPSVAALERPVPDARSVQAAAAPAPRADPMQTAAVAAERVRRAAGLEPFAMPAAMPREGTRTDDPRPAAFVHAGAARAVPTPTPRP